MQTGPEHIEGPAHTGTEPERYPIPEEPGNRVSGIIQTFREENNMNKGYYRRILPIAYTGMESDDPLSFDCYNANEEILGKTLEAHLRLCADPTFFHPPLSHAGRALSSLDKADPLVRILSCFGDSLEPYFHRINRAFELFGLLGLKHFAVDNTGLFPDSSSFDKTVRNARAITQYLECRLYESRIELHCGVADLGTHPRYSAGSACNPDPDVFAYAASMAKIMLDVSHNLNASSCLLQSVMRGYDTLLNTSPKRALGQLGAFLQLIVEYKHRIGYRGRLLIESSPLDVQQPTFADHTLAVYGLLEQYSLEKEYQLLVRPVNGRLIEKDVSLALALDALGGIDVGCDRFRVGRYAPDRQELAMTYYQLLINGGLFEGNSWLDVSAHPYSLESDDQLMANIGYMDQCARAFKAAVGMYIDRTVAGYIEDRYAGWQDTDAQMMLSGEMPIELIAKRVANQNVDPRPESSRMEYLTNQVNRFV